MTEIALVTASAVALAAVLAALGLARARQYALRRAEAAEGTAAQHAAHLAERDRQLAGLQAAVTRAEERAAVAERSTRELTEELGHLAAERVPAAALALVHPDLTPPGPLHRDRPGAEAGRAMEAVLTACTTAVLDERARVDAAARAAMRGATAKVQTLLHQAQNLLTRLQHEHDDPRLLELDFRNELALRRIQATAVLCEAWPGLARTDSPLVETLLGAQSRVPGYGRVKIANHLREQRLAVAARAAEPLVITFAELLANATAYSHPETEIPVTVQQGGQGAVVVIDDAGIGIDTDQLDRARRLLDGPSGVLLTELGNPPQTGFAVIGKLARQYGFACHVEPSPYGGVRAIVRVPDHLLTLVDTEHDLSVLTPEPVRPAPVRRAPGPDDGPGEGPGEAPGEPPAAEPAEPARASAPPAEAPTAPPPAGGSASLPTRRRRSPRPGAASGQAETGNEDTTPPVRTPEQAAARWAALQEGTTDGRSAAGAGADTAPRSDTAHAADTSAASGAAPIRHSHEGDDER
ncbi:ATP-binding protein [Streptomyces sp. GSL17-111]|uniref:ATP-binding protein n=1 Tax=Streptomyces sp. GSL17-111 TaxID=3121596 RepID=UPI0030F4A404